jgi:lipoteichoic acid synthase
VHSISSVLRQQVSRYFLLAYTAAAILFKSIVLCGYIIETPFLTWNLREALDNIPLLSVHVCFIAMFVAPALLFRNRARYWYLFGLNLVLSALFIIDLWNYRAFVKFTSFYNLRQVTSLKVISPAIVSLVHAGDFVLFLDLPLLLLLCLLLKPAPFRRNAVAFVVLFALSFGCFAYLNATEDVDGQAIFDLRWQPLETICTLSPIGYHVYDLYRFVKEHRALQLSPAERERIAGWLRDQKEALPANKYYGRFRGKNLILIQCESLENFVIRKSVDGQEITPNLNRLVAESLYYDNFMEQVSSGTSADAEFIVNTSIYPMITGYVSWEHPGNRYNSLPRLLEKRGYATIDMHPEPASFWNWAQCMTGVGMSRCLDQASFRVDEIIGLGLSDASFLPQAASVITDLRRPFYAFMVTETNHYPYELPEKLRELKLDRDLDSSQVGGYLQSVHYMDRQIGSFLSRLDSTGLLDDTVVGIYGDHCGIHWFSQDALAKLKEAQRKWMENGKRVPLLLYSKGMHGEVISRLGGQVDVLPTIAALMGIDESEYGWSAMGRNLLNTQRDFVVLNGGEFVGSGTGEQRAHALQGLVMGDLIIKGNYFKDAGIANNLPRPAGNANSGTSH